MRQTETNSKLKAMMVLAAFMMLAAPALAQNDPKRQILISIPDRKLALIEAGEVKKVYPIAVGAKRSPSPAGQFSVVNRVVKPTYYHKGTVIPTGPQNPLGTRWMGLSHKGYGIHGTNAPHSIGKAASHGCIRMAKADLEELFELVRVGDTVEIRAEADTQTSEVFGGVVTVAQTTVATETSGAQ